VPEVGGPLDPNNEAHDLIMSVFGGRSNGDRRRIKVRVRTAMATQADGEALTTARQHGQRQIRMPGCVVVSLPPEAPRAAVSRVGDDGQRQDDRELLVHLPQEQRGATINAARTGWHNPHPVLVHEIAQALGIPEADLAAIAGVDDATFGAPENTTTRPDGPQ
jgi:hypothetical protein